jgi:hypothetical protein
MGLADLLDRLEHQTDTPDTPEHTGGVSGKSLPLLGCTLDTPDTPKNSNGEERSAPEPPDLLGKLRLQRRHSFCGVSGVSRVQASIGGACADTPSVWLGVSGVSRRDERHALAVEPIEPEQRKPGALLAGEQEPAILAWLTAIGETDQVALAGVLEYCRRDHEALAYFAGRAAADLPKPDYFPDDRRPCNQCANLYGGACIVAKPGGLVSALRGYRPSLADVRIRCAGYSTQSNDAKEAT